MDLQLFWFILIGVLWAGYFLLEGFDFGVGMLLPFLPRNERERDTMFGTIGPVWGNGTLQRFGEGTAYGSAAIALLGAAALTAAIQQSPDRAESPNGKL